MTSLVNARFATPRGWRSAHLQTIRNQVLRRRYDLEAVSTARDVLVDTHDDTGDRLAVTIHRTRATACGPLVGLVHGLGGSAESAYVRASALGLLAAGFNVARVDLRGAGRTIDSCRERYHAGRTDDLRWVFRHLAEQDESRADGRPRLAAMGFSLGGNSILKLLGEPLDGLPLVAGVSVCAPLDLATNTEHLHHMAFGLYERSLMRGLRRDALRPGAVVTDEERVAIRAARLIVHFDDAVTAKRNGWRDAAEYYAVNSAAQFLPRITVPTLVIHALDDPMVPAGSYQAIDWAALAEAGYVRHEITARGGHCGFHAAGEALPWYVGRAVAHLGALPGVPSR